MSYMSMEESDSDVTWIWLSFLLIVIYFIKLFFTKPPKFITNVTANRFRTNTRTNTFDTLSKKIHIADEIFLDGIGIVPICCNQTARLGEAYCQCGRAVSKKLLKYYSVL